MSSLRHKSQHGKQGDYEEWLEELAPNEPISQYRHNQMDEDNGNAKSLLPSQTVSLILVPGSGSFMASATADEGSGC
jgi:hypothetical protein